MKTTVLVDPGVCGFMTRIQAESEDEQYVTFRIVSGCKNIRAFSESLIAKGPVDGYAELGAGFDGVVLSASRATLKGCCAGCAVPFATFKAMQVAARVALPKDVTLMFNQGSTNDYPT